MAIVSCPECGKKLKIADASIGKKVKCTCANVFVAALEPTVQAAPVKRPPATAALTAEKVFVSCTDCDAKLKVATTSLGKKMKCPKCASVFVANLPEAASGKAKGPLAELDGDDLLDDAPPARTKGKAKGKPAKDEMDDFFAFAQQEAERAPANEYEEDLPKGKGKQKYSLDDYEPEDEPAPRGKAKKPIKPSRRMDEEDEEKETKTPVYPRRTFLNVLVTLMLLGYVALLVDAFFFNLHDFDLYGPLGAARPKEVALGKKVKDPLIGVPKKGDPNKAAPPFDFAARHKVEQGWLDLYRKEAGKSETAVVSLKPHEKKIVGLAFSPVTSILAAVSVEHEKEGIKLWDLATKTPVKSIALELKGTRPLVTFSPEGEFIAVASGKPDHFLKVFQVADGTKAFEVKLQKMPQALAFSADGKRLSLTLHDAVAAADLQTWTVWDWQAAKLEGKTDKVSDYVLAGDASKLVAVTAGGTAIIYDQTTNTAKPILVKSPIAGNARISRDGKWLVNPAPKETETSLLLIDLDTGDTKEIAEEKEKIDRIQLSPDGTLVLYETAGEYKLLEIESLKLRWSIAAEIDALAFSPAGVFLARTEMGTVQLLAVDELVGGKKIDDTKEKKIDDTKGKADTKLDGAWKVESAEEDGKIDKKLAGTRFAFANSKVTTPDGDQAFSVDDTKTPKWLTMTISKELSVPGIYKLDGDTLHWCFAGPDKEGNPGPRPTSFDSKQGMLLVLKRLPKEEAKAPAFYHLKSQNNLKEMVLGMHAFHDATKALPTNIFDPAGKPLLSWRVALLPFIDQDALYKEFDLTKPWDDPHNKKLITKMPEIYVVPGTDGKTGKTHYRSLAGPGTPLEPQKTPDGKLVGRKFTEFTDGITKVIVIVEARAPVEWTRPDDLPLDPKGPLPKFGVAPDGFNAAFADGAARLISANVSEKVLRPYLTCDNKTPRSPLDTDGKD